MDRQRPQSFQIRDLAELAPQGARRPLPDIGEINSSPRASHRAPHRAVARPSPFRVHVAVTCALLLAAVACACSPGTLEAAPEDKRTADPRPAARSLPEISADRLCVTKGTAALGARITEPTVRGVALGSAGDAATLRFRFRGGSPHHRALASGQSRRQLGLKLRAQDGCNLVYVMWRLDPKPLIEVSIKRNPGKRTHEECGADGYTKLRPARSRPVPALAPGASHTLTAEISGDELLAWIDGRLSWRGPLPAAAREISGPAGLRSDNLAFDLISFSAAPSSTSQHPRCTRENGD
ncbi:MAG: hypothetical protein ACTHU0_02595 [Kofleriaceae bacterium]